MLDALEQSAYGRETDGCPARHSDHGVQYLAVHYTEWLAEARNEA